MQRASQKLDFLGPHLLLGSLELCQEEGET